ncbi:hypothetical protein [Xylophilus sp. GOD-11R]|uniref:hypothetical protein n=1 Tax=Xylophilus sp. GOD-11R TaxID=3089814 RepID=UPI00298C30FE|nr:hypothetical protein [Xylophilus sp. GOD-11R]WPB56281.1 hypothetical protein R9X41_19370 [Xylophilus sp. GOD-11R]
MGTSTGDGSRPTTDGTIDNIGAGSAFNPSGKDAPAPRERMAEKRSDSRSVEDDGSAPFGATESQESVKSDTGNQEPREPKHPT